MRFTVFGAGGFIGSACVKHLESRGHDVLPVLRDTPQSFTEPLGHVIYAIGLTADFREKPFETVEAHVCLLARLLRQTQFDSWLYLSSARIYLGGETGTAENVPISLTPDLDRLYDLSKVTGEALCLSLPSPAVRIARLSNVFGAGQNEQSFLASVLNPFLTLGRVTIREAAESAKDYVGVDDVVRMLEVIALTGQARLYNVAGGMTVTHAALADALLKLHKGTITFAEGGQTRIFPPIDISRIRNEFGYRPTSLLDRLPQLLHSFES